MNHFKQWFICLALVAMAFIGFSCGVLDDSDPGVYLVRGADLRYHLQWTEPLKADRIVLIYEVYNPLDGYDPEENWFLFRTGDIQSRQRDVGDRRAAEILVKIASADERFNALNLAGSLQLRDRHGGGEVIYAGYPFQPYDIGEPSELTFIDDTVSSDDDDDYAIDDDDDYTIDDDIYAGPPPATDVTVNPAAGATVPSNQEFTVTFNEGVTAATVNGSPATGAGRHWTASPALAEGIAALIVEWANRDGSTGSKTVGPYTVQNPDTTPPAITSGTVVDGDKDIDPAPINASGFRFDFDEAVTGSIKLTDEAGADLNWIANVKAQTATLTAIAGQEIANETTYKIEIDVQDSAGNRTQTTITFVTKTKE